MRLSEIISQIRDGTCLLDKDVYRLATKLRLVKSEPITALKISLVFVALILTVISYFILDLVFSLIISVLWLFLIVFLFNKRKQKTLINLYLEAVKTYYDKALKEYEGFQIIPTVRSFESEGKNLIRICYLISDGYEFYIIDDYLMDTLYDLPREFKSSWVSKPVLKVFDANFINKKPIYFNLTEIEFYKGYFLDKSLRNEEYRGYDLFVANTKNVELSSFVWLKLSNYRSFKFGLGVLNFLRSAVKEKEKRF